MGGEKKEPLHKSFRICLGGDHRGHKKRAEHEDPLLCDDPCHFGGGNLSDCRMEVVYLLLFVRLVMSLEIVNTAVEAVVDLVTEERKPLAKLAKEWRQAQFFLRR